jgi:hypothetical protein
LLEKSVARARAIARNSARQGERPADDIGEKWRRPRDPNGTRLGNQGVNQLAKGSRRSLIILNDVYLTRDLSPRSTPNRCFPIATPLRWSQHVNSCSPLSLSRSNTSTPSFAWDSHHGSQGLAREVRSFLSLLFNGIVHQLLPKQIEDLNATRYRLLHRTFSCVHDLRLTTVTPLPMMTSLSPFKVRLSTV